MVGRIPKPRSTTRVRLLETIQPLRELARNEVQRP